MRKRKKVEVYSREYFILCGIGGTLSCGLTHLLLTPLDLVKCNVQANPQEFPNVAVGFKRLYQQGGWRLLVRGWVPTTWGYSLQGYGKFGFYEYFKYFYANLVGKENAIKYRSLLYMSAAATAEAIADIALCPFEAVKVRVQTSPEFGVGLTDAAPKILAAEGLQGFFKGLVPLWCRQVPYTVVKFVVFEKVVEVFYTFLGRPKSEYSKGQQLLVTFGAGYIAGIVCGAVSHPADTMVSKLNKAKTTGGTMAAMNEIYYGTPGHPGIGFAGLWKGFGSRVVMIGTLAALQWFIYDSFKVYAGLPTTGGVVKKETVGRSANLEATR
eukprot:TRINITY_DN1147_c0_g2_i1.p1 TRINITY_DN1147_c0_g2~~TRINITY_DN1147_c0_g2_i1.p1  ORF type:complete len:338 (-),score=71.17 TRINITY_DN1147_c0_g2_i1:112-1086(-)